MADLVNDKGLVAATLGFTTLEMVKLWRDAAPSLAEMRAAEPGDLAMRQQVMDANYLVAGVAIMVGGSVSWLTKSWLPILLAVGSASFISWWYRMVLTSDNGVMSNGNGNSGPVYN